MESERARCPGSKGGLVKDSICSTIFEVVLSVVLHPLMVFLIIARMWLAVMTYAADAYIAFWRRRNPHDYMCGFCWEMASAVESHAGVWCCYECSSRCACGGLMAPDDSACTACAHNVQIGSSS